jgi:hypothetical protein
VQHAIETVGEKATPVVSQISEQAAPHRSKIIAAGVAALVLVVVLRRRSAS